MKFLSIFALCLGFLYSSVAMATDGDSERNYCQQHYDAGYKKGYGEGQKSYDCKKEKHKSYNKGYGEGLQYKGGYDGGYKKGYDKGYSTARNDYPGGGDTNGFCAFVFKFDGFIIQSDDPCDSSQVCEDNDLNTIDVCLFGPLQLDGHIQVDDHIQLE